MSTSELKSELNQLINSINDSKTLKALHTLLTARKEKQLDWWNAISDGEKKAIRIGMQQLLDGKGVPHEEVRKKVGALLYKRK